MDKLNYRYYGISEKGRRQTNEDAVLTLRLDDDTFFFAIADGMGGVRGGEIASNLVLQKIMNELELVAQNKDFNSNNIREILKDLFQLAQNEVTNYVETHDELKGMGTTLAALLIHKDHYVWGNIGDSRIYKLTATDILRYTVDHNLMEDPDYKVEGEEIENMHEQYKHALTRAIDGSNSTPDIFPVDEPWLMAEKNDTWIFCSDGLLIDKQENYNQLLFRMANKVKEPQHLAQRLVSYALENGSTDNVSVIVVKTTSDDQPEPEFTDNTPTLKMQLNPDTSSNHKTSIVRPWIRNFIIILIVMTLIILGMYFSNSLLFSEGSFWGVETIYARDIYIKTIEV